MTHDALRRLGVFSVGDEVLYRSDDDADDEEPAVVVEMYELGSSYIRIRFTAFTGPSGKIEHLWTRAENLRHVFPRDAAPAGVTNDAATWPSVPSAAVRRVR